MLRLKKFFIRYWPIGFIVSFVLLLFITNYKPGTWLFGWDNLMTEFNFPLNITRAIFSVWEEYQGLGLMAGMAHASDLPRELLLWILGFLLPSSLLRYVFQFLMVAIGMMGMYFFSRNSIFKESRWKEYAAVLGALLYVCNLGTIQYFYVPFEPYSAFWGFFPWEMYAVFLYLFSPSKKHLLFFALISICAIPQAYVQTVFLVYLICLFLVFCIYVITNRSLTAIKRCLALSSILFLVNAFWLLPNIYFTLTNLHVTQNAMQNKMATEKFFQMNKNRGTLTDLPLLREFYYDFFDYNYQADKFDFLMKSWRTYFSSPVVLAFGYLTFLGVLFGLSRNHRFRRYFLGLFILCSIIFLSNTPIFSQINDVFRSFPVINQILRNPFTKFIVPTIFIFSVGFASCMLWLFTILEHKKLYPFSRGIFIFLVLAILAYLHPIFQGEFIDPQMRVPLPKAYQDLFAYLNTQDKDARIMNMPVGNFWGWEYYRWGTHGSGFLWYGIEQPIMDRAFDVWSSQDENYYWELSYAINKNDVQLFNTILEKYQIHYILFDDSLVFGPNLASGKLGLEQKQLVEESNKVSLVKTFGTVSLYKTTLATKTNHNISLFSSLPSAKKQQTFDTQDNAYLSLGNYYSPHNDTDAKLTYPFGSLFTNRFQNEQTFSVSKNTSSYTLMAPMTQGNYLLTIPSYSKNEPQILVQFFAKKQGQNIIIKVQEEVPTVTIAGRVVYTLPAVREFSFHPTTMPKSFYVDVNNNDFFLVSNLGNAYTPVGESYIHNTNENNIVKLYSADKAVSRQLPVDMFQKAHMCGRKNDNLYTYSFVKNNQLVMQARNTAGCSVYTGTLPDTQNVLMKATFTYQSKSDEYPQFCYYANSADYCINKKDTITQGFSPELQSYTSLFEGDPRPNDNVYFQMILETQANDEKYTVKEIHYANITLSEYPYIAGGALNLQGFQDTSITIPVSITQPGALQVRFPKVDDSSSFSNPITKHLYRTTPLNYDTLMPGTFDLQTVGNAVNLHAQDASSYLLFTVDNLPGDEGYIVQVDAENKESFPLTVNIFSNKEFRTYTYTFAASGDTLVPNYFILPPVYAFDHGVNVLLGSTSYNSTTTSNDVKNVSIYPMPYEYITSLSFAKLGNQMDSPTTTTTVQKHNYTNYSVIAIPASAHFLMLSQAYDPGWHAYQTSSENFLTTYFPFLFAKEIPQHIVINNWENGWNLDGINRKDGTTITIVYLPQYLEYLGFLLLLPMFVWIAFLLYPLLHRNKSERDKHSTFHLG